MWRSALLSILGVSLAGGTAAADGLALDAGAGVGWNSDDMAIDFAGSHSMASLFVGYRFRTGTQAFVTGALGLGGHEAVFSSYGGGIRQYITLGRFEPFVEVGVHEVGDDVRLAPALGFGVGVQARIGERFFAGASANHYLSRDTDAIGGLDWSGRLFVGARLGATTAPSPRP